MKVIYNRFIPFGHYYGINLFGVVFARKEMGLMSEHELNHEYIHTLQQREMLFIFFYLWYVLEWAIKVIRYRDTTKAYYHISFEKEAYKNEYDLDYRKNRKLFAWLRK